MTDVCMYGFISFSSLAVRRGPRGKLTLMCYVQTKAVETQMSMTRMDLAPIATRSLHPLDSEVSTRPKCCGELPHAMESSPFLQDLVHE